jgi:hypothetical protein
MQSRRCGMQQTGETDSLVAAAACALALCLTSRCVALCVNPLSSV